MSATEADESTKHEHPRPVVIVLDDEPLDLPEHRTTPDAILKLTKLDPATHYLVHLKGRERVSYKGKGHEELHVHKDERFVSVSTEPTPTS